MPPADRPPITQVLHQLAAGESGASDRLLTLVYDELRRRAGDDAWRIDRTIATSSPQFPSGH